MALPARAIGNAVDRLYAARSGGKAKPKKPVRVNLGQKGSFTIKHPGAFRAKAQAAGESTAAYAQKMKGAGGVTGRQARSAIGLMAMGHK
jgi:hypothetical protein